MATATGLVRSAGVGDADVDTDVSGGELGAGGDAMRDRVMCWRKAV